MRHRKRLSLVSTVRNNSAFYLGPAALQLQALIYAEREWPYEIQRMLPEHLNSTGCEFISVSINAERYSDWRFDVLGDYSEVICVAVFMFN